MSLSLSVTSIRGAKKLFGGSAARRIAHSPWSRRWLSTGEGHHSNTGKAANAGCRPTRLVNSITHKKEELKFDEVVSWYTCGPTVYDHAHVGHARAYVALDIVRRVLISQGYNVYQVMGVTDVDDKIINRAKADGQVGTEGAAGLAGKYEKLFLKDMRLLGVLPPDSLTRVSEFIPDIVAFIADLERLEFAYVGSGSGTVWFDTKAYGSRYGVLEPSRGFGCGHDHGEDELADAGGMSAEKRDRRDFALWKPTKEEGEAAWESPWGMGRPGWHIECSSFCRAMFGDKPPAPLLHSGGRDLKFPHHENEIAQSQALMNTDRWVQHWIHAGQLSIKGLKMSKSLKNYISIQDYLSQGGSPALWRIFCLLHRYHADIEWGADGEAEAKAWHKSFGSFFQAVAPFTPRNRYAIYEESPQGSPLRWTPELLKLNDSFVECRREVISALQDDIDTPGAMRALKRLMGATQQALGDLRSSGAPDTAAWPLVGNIAHYVRETLESWGLETSEWCSDSGIAAGGGGGEKDVVAALLSFRDSMRAAAIAEIKAAKKKDGGADGGGSLAKEVMRICDELRDVTLPALGVAVQDRRPVGKPNPKGTQG